MSALSTGALACGKDDSKGKKEGGGGDDEPSTKAEDRARVYPQGLASGDPKPSSVILWTRVEPPADGDHSADVPIEYEIATDELFSDVVAEGEGTAKADADHTFKLKVEDLDPYTTYYYRFTAQNVRSEIGRTKTAPAKDADVKVRFAFATCQDYVGRFYHAWKVLTDEPEVDFVVFLGDYVYETDGDPSFQTPGEGRKIVLPDGILVGEVAKAAVTLADYRSLYKQYRSDPELQKAHRLYPFITIWDDHEFANDCWGDHTTHFNDTQGDEKNSAQRQDADRAWFEYQPADVPYTEGASYPDDIRIYRQFRFGAHFELFMTDERYYRDDHVIPEGPADLEVGKFLEDSEIGARIFVLKNGFDPKEAAKAPTMLGAEQKQWLIDAVKASEATWKFWGTEVQLSQMLADLSSFTQLPPAFQDRFYLTVDQWDGFRTERKEILTALAGVENLVAIAGDIHAFYASDIYADFDDTSAGPVCPEYTVAGITSYAIAPAAGEVLGSNDTFKTLGLLELIPRFDELLQQGSPHYKYANSTSNGIAICDVTADEIRVSFLIVPDVTVREFDGTVTRVDFRTASGSRRVLKV